jgi:hypothetical protein
VGGESSCYASLSLTSKLLNLSYKLSDNSLFIEKYGGPNQKSSREGPLYHFSSGKPRRVFNSPEEPAHANSTFKGLSYHPGMSHAELKRRITGEQKTILIEDTSPFESFETPLLDERKGRVYVGVFSIL